MAKPFRDYHNQLLAAIGTPGDYNPAWGDVARGVADLVTMQGFDARRVGIPAAIRTRMVTPRGEKRRTEAAMLRAAAQAPEGATGPAATAGAARALALKTVRHLYMQQSFGKQKVWILSLPESLRAFPVEFANSSADTVDKVLDSGGERFSAKAISDLGEACQLALAWVGRAMIVAGAPLLPEHRKLFHRWFVPAGTPDEATKITDHAARLLPQLQRIAAGLKTGQVILTDSPHERGTASGLEHAEGFGYFNDLIAIHIEKGFFSTANTLSGKTNWARVLVHELSHLYARTVDHAYSWQGLLPRDDDALTHANGAHVRRDPKFPAVRTLTLEQCRTNADSWAFFVADAAGALTAGDRMQALGARLYDSIGERMDPATAVALRSRAA
ncbi:M35 family metallo-endopeptidase [Polymorphobacter fuscus]|nr:M35 family metallo-endopeptidase [Polymorphobacter fuscus]NJC10045.1 hypothetical protein [Polymorphobacter fuscus]